GRAAPTEAVRPRPLRRRRAETPRDDRPDGLTFRRMVDAAEHAGATPEHGLWRDEAQPPIAARQAASRGCRGRPSRRLAIRSWRPRLASPPCARASRPG